MKKLWINIIVSTKIYSLLKQNYKILLFYIVYKIIIIIIILKQNYKIVFYRNEYCAHTQYNFNNEAATEY